MTLLDFFFLMVIAAFCGLFGQAIAGYSIGGCFFAIVIGFVGAWIGVWLARELGLPPVLVVQVGGRPFPVVWSIFGSAILSAAFGLIGRRRIV